MGKLSGDCAEVVRKVKQVYLDVEMLSAGCEEADWKVWGGCLEGVWRVSGGYGEAV